MKTAVWYHGGCWDGFCAAWIFHTFLLGETADYVPVQYGQQPPSLNGCQRLFIVDFSYPRDVLKSLRGQLQELVVLDHHKTAAKELEGLEFCKFDMNKSGGRLAWEYVAAKTDTPWLVDYTEDRDLWRWRLDWSKEINAWLRSWPLDFKLWDKFAIVGPGCEAWDARIDEGSAILRREKQIVDEHVSHACECFLDGHKVLAVNATVLFSDIAGELASNRPFGVAWFTRNDGKVVHSLRSRETGVDVSEVAKRFGGGGHKNAAGFESDKFQGYK